MEQAHGSISYYLHTDTIEGELSIYGTGVVDTDTAAGTVGYQEVVMHITGAPDSVLQAVIKDLTA